MEHLAIGKAVAEEPLPQGSDQLHTADEHGRPSRKCAGHLEKDRACRMAARTGGLADGKGMGGFPGAHGNHSLGSELARFIAELEYVSANAASGPDASPLRQAAIRWIGKHHVST
jgi:hypothetical protein